MTEVGFSQKTKRITVKSKKPNTYTERYVVMKINSHIKHGDYIKKSGKNIVSKGFYKYNQPDSLWEYYSTKNVLMAKGYYNNGSKKGIWEYYSYAGNLVQKYDHDKDSLLLYDTLEEKKFFPYLQYINSPNKQVAWPIGGYCNLYSTIEQQLQFPAEMWGKDTGVYDLKLSVLVEINGNTTQVKVINPKGNLFEKEAVKVVESLKHSWIPAKINHQLVGMSYIIPVHFQAR